MLWRWLFSLLWLAGVCLQPAAAVSAVDDHGRTVQLQRPAQRVISLAPHATELLFAAGGGGRVVGVVEWSDWPPPARALPRVGDNRAVDIERVLALKPDLLVLWDHGGNSALLQRLEQLGVPVFYSTPRTLEQMISSIERLGLLLNTTPLARRNAGQLRQRVQRLRQQHAGARPVSLFYQVWHQPLMTLGGKNLLQDVLQVCGARSIFAHLPAAAPIVDREAVLALNPEVILTGSRGARRDASLLEWRRWPQLRAVRQDNLLALEADHLQRPGPRLVDAAEALCRQLQQVRRKSP